jgi:hypothetical protein
MKIERPNYLPETVKNFHGLRIFTQHKKFLALLISWFDVDESTNQQAKNFCLFPHINEGMLSSSPPTSTPPLLLCQMTVSITIRKYNDF